MAHSTSSLDRVIYECQPFLDDAATLVCVGCLKLIVFPSGAKKVRCTHCHTITSAVRVRCTSCRAVFDVPLAHENAKCTACSYQFSPLTKMKIVVPSKAVTKDDVVRLIHVTLQLPSSVSTLGTATVQVVMGQPLRESALLWSNQLHCNLLHVSFYKNGKLLKAAATGRELELKDGDALEAKVNEQKVIQGHDFSTSQFAAPTNCAACKKFIWGIYHQGKRCTKCRLPVHHRCAGNITSTCESDLRDLFGIVNTNDDDDEGDTGAVLGVVVDDEDKIAFLARLEEKVAPECNAQTMQQFDKITNFTDEEIAELWLRYDADQSGALDHDEVRALMSDLVAGGGAHVTELTDLRAAVDHLVARMDTDQDGSISWEEFWNFFKAQQDASYFSTMAASFQGAELSLEAIYELWRFYDSDGSGTLEVDEILKLLGDMIEHVRQKAPTKHAATMLEKTYKGKFESFLTSGEAVTWETFYTTLVPLLQQGSSL